MSISQPAAEPWPFPHCSSPPTPLHTERLVEDLVPPRAALALNRLDLGAGHHLGRWAGPALELGGSGGEAKKSYQELEELGKEEAKEERPYSVFARKDLVSRI